ncbi:MAG: response regulator [Actinobacteria bacterium]|nr:MAG: response regulator [Actinomycetota bacterium]
MGGRAERQTRPRRVLLIDDDPVFVRGLAVSLKHEGYEVTTLTHGGNALDVIARIRPHAVVLDVMMPQVDGWEVLRLIRESPATSELPVLMLTAKGSEQAKVLGFSLGADDYLTKPFSLNELRCRIGALLRRAENGKGDKQESQRVAVVSCSSGLDFIGLDEIYYIEGVRNYTYVHTCDGRFLSRMSLREVEEGSPERYMRVHRSYIVNLDKVTGCRWATKSSFRLRLSNVGSTEIPVSRRLVSEVQGRLGIRRG